MATSPDPLMTANFPEIIHGFPCLLMLDNGEYLSGSREFASSKWMKKYVIRKNMR
jgi:hypothetical protein